MSDDRSSLSRAFDKARDPVDAWRQQQISALTDEQRKTFDRHRQEEQRKLEAEKKRVTDQKQAWLQEEKQRRLLSHQQLALRMRPKTGISERRAEELARDASERQAAAAIDRASHDMQQRLDDYLRQAERERRREEFNRTATGGDRQQDSLSRAFDKASRHREQARTRSQDKHHGRDRQRDDI